jgi:hypothetical protein
MRAVHPDPDRVRSVLTAMAIDLDVEPGPVADLIAVLQTPRGEVTLRREA